jgi:hypothetical protein
LRAWGQAGNEHWFSGTARIMAMCPMTETREYTSTRGMPPALPKGVETLSVAALDAMSFGIAVLDDSGLVYANQAMMRISAENDGLNLSAAGLVLADQDEQAHYLKVMGRVLQAVARDSAPDTVVISASRPSGKNPMASSSIHRCAPPTS